MSSPEKHIERAERLADRFDQQLQEALGWWGRGTASEATIMAARKKRTDSKGVRPMPEQKDDITVREREVPIPSRRLPYGDHVDHVGATLSLRDALDAIPRLRTALFSLVGIGGFVVAMLIWFGWQNYSPGSRMDKLDARVDTLTKLTIVRDSLLGLRLTYFERFMQETAYQSCFVNARTNDAKAACADKYLLQGGAASAAANVGARR
jgi:hypothetical protein